ncbi:MAG: hypothetical protein HRU12_07195 [Phaeodactylibacter sp.]|nr:hypothetical protein [Phaeodactylibacter sp.]
MIRLLLLTISLVSCLQTTWGSDREIVYIDSISVTGNKHTLPEIILREMSIREGDTILLEELSEKIIWSEQMIMNTGLFQRAQISYQSWKGETNEVQLLVTVEEMWFLYPIPVFELADRNFNVWWVDQNRSLDRTNYGIEFAHINLTGRKDKLRSSIKHGYTRRYALSYSLPYINKAQTLGAFAGVGYWRNREINYRTAESRQQFFRSEEEFVYERFTGEFGFTYRPKLQSYHNIEMSFTQKRISDDIALDLNPDYLLDGRHRIRYFTLRYDYFHENRDVAPYPWSGSFCYGSLIKEGLSVFGERSGLTLLTGYGKYLPWGERWSLGVEMRSKLSIIRSRQPYQDNRGLGFSNHTMRGWEYYIIDGMDMAMGQSSLRFRFAEYNFNFGKLMPIQQLRKMPIRLLLSLNNDIGYVNSPYARADNPHSNRLLWGGGVGLDIVLYYDKVIQIQYSYNDLLENGLFLHLSMNI